MKANFNKDKVLSVYDGEQVKEIVTDESKLGTMVECIDPIKQGKLLQEITIALKNTIKANNLTALSAPAIGYPYRVFCVAFDGGKDIRTYINAMISQAEGFTFNREKCSSLPNREFIRPRNTKITVQYFTPLNKITAIQLVGKTSYVFQHEIDHMDGCLLSDIGLEIDNMFDEATEDERAEVLRAYCEALDISEKKAKEEIQSNPELKKMDDAINYLVKKSTGEIDVEQVKISKEEYDKITENAEKECVNESTPVVEQPKKRGRKKKIISEDLAENQKES